MPIEGIFAGVGGPPGETTQRVLPKGAPNKRIQPTARSARRG
jgi:hypothetical protein